MPRLQSRVLSWWSRGAARSSRAHQLVCPNPARHAPCTCRRSCITEGARQQSLVSDGWSALRFSLNSMAAGRGAGAVGSNGPLWRVFGKEAS